jgi:glycosyltransferase involved in cell wall biosynthesis
VTRHGSELARRTAAEGLTVRGVPWSLGLDPRAWWRIVVEALGWRPELLHAHDNHAVDLAVWARVFLEYAGRGPAPRVVATRRVLFPPRRRSALRRADAVIAISAAVRSVLIASGFPTGEVTLVPSGIDPDEVRRTAEAPLEIRSTLGLATREPVVANVAALEPPKDQRTLLRAAAAARPLRPDLHWVIAGDGPERGALQAEIRRLGLGDLVHLLGPVERAAALLREANVLVMSSRAEGLGTVVLQALALGTPVVATRAGGLAELVPEAWLVTVGDGDGLARKVVQALDHPERTPLPAQYTAAAMAAGVLAVYRSLI